MTKTCLTKQTIENLSYTLTLTRVSSCCHGYRCCIATGNNRLLKQRVMAKRSFRNIDCTNRFSKPVRSVQTQRDPAFEKVQFKKVDTEIFLKSQFIRKRQV